MSDETAVTATPDKDGGNASADGTEVTTAATPDANTTTTETKAETPQVPEAYEFAMPEGMQLDKAAADEFSAIAKELKLDQATAQKVADVAVKQAQRQAEAHTKLVESWVEQVKTDKEIGGDNLEQNLAIAKKALDTFGTPELKDVLNSTGLGNHPAVIRAFIKAGKAISDDGFVTGSPKGAETDMARKMFPTMN